jgi:aryl-alcohol dehydrogenase-like predicted oxidoreductase
LGKRIQSMERPSFGKTGMQVGMLGFGGAEIGYDHTPADTVDSLLNTALDAGLNVIDIAEAGALERNTDSNRSPPRTI